MISIYIILIIIIIIIMISSSSSILKVIYIILYHSVQARYKQLALRVHPDKCAHPRAKEAYTQEH